MFNEEFQKTWYPKVGDVIVGCTGNIFVVSAKHELRVGDLFFFGGGLCNRDGGHRLNETYSSTMNEDGLWYEFGKEPKAKCYHSSWKDFRFVPYPHEIKKS